MIGLWRSRFDFKSRDVQKNANEQPRYGHANLDHPPVDRPEDPLPSLAAEQVSIGVPSWTGAQAIANLLKVVASNGLHTFVGGDF